MIIFCCSILIFLVNRWFLVNIWSFLQGSFVLFCYFDGWFWSFCWLCFWSSWSGGSWSGCFFRFWCFCGWCSRSGSRRFCDWSRLSSGLRFWGHFFFWCRSLNSDWLLYNCHWFDWLSCSCSRLLWYDSRLRRHGLYWLLWSYCGFLWSLFLDRLSFLWNKLCRSGSFWLLCLGRLDSRFLWCCGFWDSFLCSWFRWCSWGLFWFAISKSCCFCLLLSSQCESLISLCLFSLSLFGINSIWELCRSNLLFWIFLNLCHCFLFCLGLCLLDLFRSILWKIISRSRIFRLCFLLSCFYRVRVWNYWWSWCGTNSWFYCIFLLWFLWIFTSGLNLSLCCCFWSSSRFLLIGKLLCCFWTHLFLFGI